MENRFSLYRPPVHLLLLIVGAVFLFGNNQMISVTLPVIIIRRGGSVADAGLVGGAASAGAILGRFLVRFALQRFDARHLLVAVGLCLLPLTLMFLPLTTLEALVLVRMIHAGLFASLMTVFLVAAVEQSATDNVGAVVALTGLAMPVALSTFPYLATTAIRHRFASVIVLAIVAAIVLIIFFIAALIRQRAEPLPTTPLLTEPAGNKQTQSSQSLGLILFATTSIGLTDGVALDLIPLFAQYIGIADYRYYFVIYAISLLIAQMAIFSLIDLAGAHRISIVGLLLMGIAFLLLGQASSLSDLVVVACLQAVGFVAAQNGLSVMSIQGLPPALRGQPLSLVYLLFEVGRGGGLVVMGQLILRAGYEVASFTVCVWCVCASMAAIFVQRRGPTQMNR